jgi:hypothetical protein
MIPDFAVSGNIPIGSQEAERWFYIVSSGIIRSGFLFGRDTNEFY